jgi:hypothetical protein
VVAPSCTSRVNLSVSAGQQRTSSKQPKGLHHKPICMHTGPWGTFIPTLGLSIYLSIYPSIEIYLSIYLSIYLHIYLSIYLERAVQESTRPSQTQHPGRLCHPKFCVTSIAARAIASAESATNWSTVLSQLQQRDKHSSRCYCLRYIYNCRHANTWARTHVHTEHKVN